MPVIIATLKAEIRRIQPRAYSSQDPISKKPFKKRLVEWLKVKALSSSPSTAKNKQKN
jgi:hypothetical protein